MPRNHLYIAGTGRAGTTFLVRYLTALGLDTTLSRNPEMQDYERANAGIEVAPEHLDHEDAPYWSKVHGSIWSSMICSTKAPSTPTR